MKKQPVYFCIAALILSLISEPYTVNAAALSTQKKFKAAESKADTKQEQPLTPEVPIAPEHPTTSLEPLTSEEPSTSIEPSPSEEPSTSIEPSPSDEPLSKIPVRLTDSDATEKTITLEWDSVNNAAEYIVLSLENKTWVEKSRTKETTGTFLLSGYGTGSSFKICSYDSEQKQTGESAEIKATIPAKVKNLKTTAYSKTKVKLYWEAAKGANFYSIYQKQNDEKYKLIKNVKKTDTRLNIKNKENYKFKIVPLFKSTLGTIAGNTSETNYSNVEFVSMDHQKYTYEEMCGDIKSLCKKYSEYVSYETIGSSEEGREIYDVILGNKDADKSILVVSTLHAREYIATVICMKQLEYYLLNYNKTVDGQKLSDVFSKCNVHYVMMANPDGVVISQTKKARWKGNANGVNLNRNFPYAFKRDGSRKDGSYSGKKAASESETQAIISLTEKLNKTQTLAVVNYHAMGQIIFGDYEGKNQTLRSDISRMYKIAKDTTGYSSAAGYGGTSNGNYREYLIQKTKIPNITIEVGSVSCPVPEYQYATAFKRNKLLILREAVWLGEK